MEFVRTESAELEGPASARGELLRQLLIGTAVFVVVAVGVPRLTPGFRSTLPPTEQAMDLRYEAALLIEEIEAYRNERGRLPDPSYVAAFLEEGYEYQPMGPSADRYVVRRTADDVSVTYDGSVPLGIWLRVGSAP